MSTITATLAVRPAGSTTWIPVDPDSPAGARFLASLGILTNPMEDVMTAATAATTHQPSLRLVSDTKTNYGLILRAKIIAQRTLTAITALPKAAWGWAARTLHLEAAGQAAGGLLGWVRTKAMNAASFLGTPFFLGAGMIALSTGTGRKAIATGFRPARWAVGLVDKVWCRLATFADDHLGAPGSWTADRMMDIEEFFAGNSRKPGVIARGVDLYNTHVAKWLATDSLIMRGLRTAGLAIVGSKLVAVAALIPLGMFSIVLQYAVGIAVAVVVGVNALGFALNLYSVILAATTGRNELGQFTSVEHEATVEASAAAADGTVPSPPATKKTAAAAAVPAHGNRAHRRATAKAPR